MMNFRCPYCGQWAVYAIPRDRVFCGNCLREWDSMIHFTLDVERVRKMKDEPE